jgi:hypothetical protein
MAADRTPQDRADAAAVLAKSIATSAKDLRDYAEALLQASTDLSESGTTQDFPVEMLRGFVADARKVLSTQLEAVHTLLLDRVRDPEARLALHQLYTCAHMGAQPHIKASAQVALLALMAKLLREVGDTAQAEEADAHPVHGVGVAA